MRFIGNVEEDTQIRAVASGTLSNGDTVVVNSDGTVSAVGSTSVTQSLGSETVFASVNTQELMGSAYDAASGKVVIAYRDGGNNYYGTAVVGTVSGVSISFGTPVVFNTALVDDNAVVYDANAEKIVICYRDNGTSNYGRAIVGTVSGTSISFGSPTTFAANSNLDAIKATYDADQQKIVICYRNPDNSYYGTAIVGAVSGTSISFGTATVFESDNASAIAVTYAANAQKILVAYRDHGNSNYGTSVVGTVSGTSISFGTPVVFHAAYCLEIDAAYDATNEKVVLAYRSPTVGTSIVGEVSGTSVSWGTSSIFNNALSQMMTISYHAASSTMIIAYKDEGNLRYGTLVVGTVSGNSITFGSEIVFNSGRTEYLSSSYDSSQKAVVVGYNDDPNLEYGTAIVFTPAYTSTNITATNFIGFADSGYLSGQNVGIDSTGSVNRSQSGLTAGQKYYVQNDGSLGTTAADPSVEAGVAISATEILVKG